MARWQDFSLGGVTYKFDHLGDFIITCVDTDGRSHSILVKFTDHVFTRDEEEGDDVADAFPNCSRTPRGYLCLERHALSFGLPAMIASIPAGRVWNLTGDDRYAHVPVIDREGKKTYYAIVFTLDRVKGAGHQFRMLIRSAHPCDGGPPATFGDVRFALLVKLRLANKHPNKNNDRHRRRPKLPA